MYDRLTTKDRSMRAKAEPEYYAATLALLRTVTFQDRSHFTVRRCAIVFLPVVHKELDIPEEA